MLKKNLLFFNFLAASIFCIQSAAAAITYTWKGSSSGTWNLASNWTPSSGSSYPGTAATDIAVFPSGGTFSITVNANITLANINETNGTTLLTINTGGNAVTVSSSIALGTNSSSLTFLGSGAVSLGGITFQNGDFLNCGSSTDASTKVTFTGANITLPNNTGNGIFNYGTFNLTTSLLYTGSTSQIVNETGATFSCTSSSIYLLNGSSAIVNSGTFNMLSSSIYLDVNPCSITNNPAGTFNMNGNSLISFSASNNEEIYNYGTFNATTGANSITMISGASDNDIFNYGTFNAGSGTSSVCTITLAATRGSIKNTSATLSSVVYNGSFNLGSGSIIKFDSSCSNCQVNNDVSCATCTFTLLSDANSSATIYQIPSGSSCPGTFNVQRYFQGSTTYDNTKKRWLARNYRIISSAVYNTTQAYGNNVYGLNYITGATAGLTTTASSPTNAFITGCTGGSTSLGNPSIYLYRESYTPSNTTFTSGNYLGITNITNSSTSGTITASDGGTYSIPVGNGVFFFFRGAASSWSTRTASPYIAPENVTLTSTGNLNQQSITVKDWYSPSSSNLGFTGSGTTGNYNVRGFNMVGNPYPSTIDWCTAYSGTGITRTNINPTIYVFNPVTNQFDTYLVTSSSGGIGTGNGSRYIMSGQGFFVQANLAGSSLIFTEAAKATAQLTGGNLVMGTPVSQSAGNQLLRIKLSVDSLNYDDIAIGFNASASTKYNPNEDAAYITGMNAIEGLSSFSDDSVKLAVNFLPLPRLNQQVIRLNVEAAKTGTYTFQKTVLDAVPQLYEIWLMDKLKQDSLDIRNNSTYAFDVDLNDTTTYGSNRFQLVIRQNPALMVHLLNFSGTKTPDGTQVVWTTENEQNYTNFSIERSTDGGATFNLLGGFASNALGTYSFIDKNPPTAKDMYRLKIQDLNGTISYSNIVTLMYANTSNTIASNISIYPNPASNVINLAIHQHSSTSVSGLSALQNSSITPGLTIASSNSFYSIRIVNTTGSVIKSVSTTQTTWQDNIAALLPGTYIIQVVSGKDNSIVGKATFIKL